MDPFLPHRKLVLLESPFAATCPEQAAVNVVYACAAMRDSIMKYGEAPFAPHILYTLPGILNDDIPVERMYGILAGLNWGQKASATVVYTDLGVTPGMQAGIESAQRSKREVILRSIPDCKQIVEAAEQFMTTAKGTC